MATPIGNMGDVTLRAIAILKGVDVIACEDTRTTGLLLHRLSVVNTLTPYHEHNAPRVRPRLLARIKAGESVALVSDAGTPLVSDPGYRLVREAREHGLPVTALPGPSAVLCALAVAGLPTDRFLFMGFPPVKAGARAAMLDEVAALRATIVFYESARRLPGFLADLARRLGPREAAVTRELTKLHEEVRREPLDVLAAHYAENGPPKGEVVVVIGPPRHFETDDEGVDRALTQALAEMSPRDAAAKVAALTGRPRRMVYARAVALSRGGTP